MNEYVCIEKCFFNNFLCEEGVVVVADDKDMKDNHCFKKVTNKKTAKSEDKVDSVNAEDILKQVALKKEQ